MARGDVHTRRRGAIWENTVEGRADLTRTFTTRVEALAAGRALAAGLARAHHLCDEPTVIGVETDDLRCPSSDEP